MLTSFHTLRPAAGRLLCPGAARITCPFAALWPVPARPVWLGRARKRAVHSLEGIVLGSRVEWFSPLGRDGAILRRRYGEWMPPAVADDPILKRFCAALAEIYGDRIERVVLFGSRARRRRRRFRLRRCRVPERPQNAIFGLSAETIPTLRSLRSRDEIDGRGSLRIRRHRGP